jgi:hypothetical protein
MLPDLSFKNMMRVRANHRAQDIAESQALLLELGTCEPTLQQCFKIIESTCISQGIYCSVDGTEVTHEFQKFMDRHYIPFLKDALRAMIIFGFVPWRVRRLSTGDKVPEVLPPGTFNWNTEVGPTDENRQYVNGRKRKHIQGIDDDTRLVTYRVTPTAGGLKEEDIKIYISTPPSLEITTNSIMTASVPSPLAHILIDYKNLRNAQIRRSYADAWNTTAHIVSTFKPNMRGQDDPTQYLMDFVHESHFAQPVMGNSVYPPLEAHNYFERDLMIRRQMQRPSTHTPMVYTLPRDHDVAQQVMLEPCEDLNFLLDKFRRDISSLTGVPHEMIIGRDNGNHETVRKTIASGRIFSTNMHELCRHCQYLLAEVYSFIYKTKKENVEFVLTPMPRLEVETIGDFKVLFEIGALTPDMSLELSRLLLGNASKPRQSKARQNEVRENKRSENFGNGPRENKDLENGRSGQDLLLDSKAKS